MNRMILKTLTKLTFKVHLDWTKLLVIVLRVWALPIKTLGLSPFEVMYGRPMVPPGLLSHQASYTLLCWQNSTMP